MRNFILIIVLILFSCNLTLSKKLRQWNNGGATVHEFDSQEDCLKNCECMPGFDCGCPDNCDAKC